LAGLAALLAGMWAGLLRIGWVLPFGPIPLTQHGALMLCGFFGAVISLERAVALGRAWSHLAPVAAGLGGVILLFGGPVPVAAALFVVNAAVFVAASGVVLNIDRSVHLGVMAVGALCLLAGNVAYAFGVAIPKLIPAWAGFLILTILGERLELNRMMRPGRGSRAVFLAAVAVTVLGILVSPGWPQAGMRIFGAGLLGLSVWLGTNDLARRTVRIRGLPRFIATTLLAGYGWLAVGGVLALALGNAFAGPHYDAVLHALSLGFVFSAIFAHAPVIVPAVLRVQLRFHKAHYAPVALLHLSLAARVAGDLWGAFELRRLGGLFNVVAILLFIALSAASVRRNPGRGDALPRPLPAERPA
jgi:hypothetical protein